MKCESVYRLPEGQEQDLEQFRVLTAQFKEGVLPAARYQAFRVPQGVYEQRESGTFMLRARLAAGILKPEQMRAAADVAEAFGNGTLHLTSRQDLQIHGVKLDGIHPALVRLAEAGLSTKGGGGNTVRNIAACPRAGVCKNEVFDTTADVIKLTEFLLPDPLSFQLPRKYKIAFSGCGNDCTAATVNDLGFIAKQRDGVDGFAVYAGGGMGVISRSGTLLEEFVPRSDAPRIAEAVKRVFDHHGNRKNRHRARLRFLMEDLGFEEFRRLYREELARIAVPDLPAGKPAPQGAHAPAIRQGAAWTAEALEWRGTNVSPQKQDGYFTVEITRPLGVIEAGQLRGLAGIVERYGETVLRATNWQHAVLRWVREDELSSLYAELSAAGLGTSEPPILRRMVVCAGAATCRLGICLSRGLAQATRDALLASDLDLHGKAGQVRVHISGCPNACGRHPVAPIGLFGAARRVNGRLAPHYIVQLGGHIEEGKTVLASGNVAVPARNLPGWLVDLLRAFESATTDFRTFLENGGREIARKIAAAHARVPSFEEDPSFYSDWGADRAFSLAGRGPGECGAGVFDLIQVDLASAGEALAAGRDLAATALAARALLVTRGEQADTDKDSIELFERLFVKEGAVAPGFAPLIARARQSLAAPDPEAAFGQDPGAVAALLSAVKKLYEEMGPSLRVAAPAPPAADATHDFRGVVCPLNYVKTKMALARLGKGQVLSVLLDEQGAANVPESASKDGHEVLAVAREENHWRVTIKKRGTF
jgi:sulfite reductase (ferredoxin)